MMAEFGVEELACRVQQAALRELENPVIILEQIYQQNWYPGRDPE